MAEYDAHLLTLPTPSNGAPVYDIAYQAWYSQSDSLIVITNHYHKRGWRVESNEYVYWESTNRNAPYPDGGTVEPAVGTVIYQWVTNG